MDKVIFPIKRIEEKNITTLDLWGDTLLSESWTVSGITADSSFASAACCIEINKSRRYQITMKHGCVSGLGCGCGCGCGTRQFLKKVGAGAAGLGD